jgi:HEPN domain-containing protein
LSTSGPDSDSAVAWFQVALGDLMAARALANDATLPVRLASALAQQAAEKAIKAAIAFAGTDPPRTHDLLALWATLRQHGVELAAAVDLAELTDGLHAGRYPSRDEESADPSDVAGLLAGAQTIVDAIRGHLESSGVDLTAIQPA